VVIELGHRTPTTLRYCANLSMLYAQLPLLERPAAAAAAGFDFVESWWPFGEPAPRAADVEAFCESLDRAGVRLVALNLDAGDPDQGERGLLSDPLGAERISANLEAAVTVLRRSGCRIVNALYGNRLDGQDPAEQDRVALDRLVAVADTLADLDAVVVLETLNTRDSPRFPLTDIAGTVRLLVEAVQQTQGRNIGLLLDVYHLATMGADPVAAIREYADMIRHVQFADAPGRGQPGTGQLDFAALEQALIDIGYDGYVGLEYEPASASDVGVSPREGDCA